MPPVYCPRSVFYKCCGIQHAVLIQTQLVESYARGWRGGAHKDRVAIFAKRVLDDADHATDLFAKAVVFIVNEVHIVEEEVVIGHQGIGLALVINDDRPRRTLDVLLHLGL